MGNNKITIQIPITLVFLILGMMLSIQFQSQSRLVNDLTMQKSEDLITMVKNLNEKKGKLESDYNQLRNRKIELELGSNSEKGIINTLESELKRLSLLNGEISVSGEGLIVTLEPDSPILYIDLIHIVNELWAAGAEAISINDIRIFYDTSLFYAEDDTSLFLTINNQRLEFPIIINAIGNASTLEKGLTLPGGIIDNLALFQAYPKLEISTSITIPAITRKPLVFAQVEGQ